jgi:POT family proton-dependent oligopeptide transporter
MRENTVKYFSDNNNGHPKQLYILFFTEMWERFSYYGMRALLVLYLTASILDGGLGWENEDAAMLYGWYTGLVYLTPMIGGLIADRLIGHRKAIILGALIMTLGHLSLAFSSIFFFYLGLSLLIIGNGLFKPNISGIVGQLYNPNDTAKKDAAYTIFYMGINVGAFLGILLCGWLGEVVGWHYGFGAAGIFMFFGLLVFSFSSNAFGELGNVVVKTNDINTNSNEPLSKIEIQRIFVILIFSFVTVFFWVAFEQAGSSMSIFARDFTKRTFDTPASANVFKTINTIISLLPIAILLYILYSVAKDMFKKIPIAVVMMTTSITIMAFILIKMLNAQIIDKNLEVPASWFGTLNSLFIFTLAPIFSRIWEKLSDTKINPSGATKFAIGLWLLSIGFGFLVYGTKIIPKGATSAQVSMIWLVLAYLFHTMGELCVSPVGLSYVNKLSPKKLLGLMFGIWFFASALANYVSGFLASYMDRISAENSLSTFFMIFVITSFIGGIIIFLFNPIIKKWMHGVK